MQDDLERRIFLFAKSVIGENLIDMAWPDFLGAGASLRPSEEQDLFIPWLLYRWRPATTRTRTLFRRSRRAPTLAESFVAEHGPKVSSMEGDFLTASLAAGFSFHEVTDVERGRSLGLKDVLRGTEATVIERSASTLLQPGDLMYARIVTLPNVQLIVGAGEIALPPDRKILLMQVRKDLRARFGEGPGLDLLAADDVLRDGYLQLRSDILHPPRPTLQNTDGDPLELQTLVWKTPGPEETFLALASLSIMASEEEIRRDATLDPSGRVRRVEFSWEKPGNKMQKSWSNTVLGRVEIDGTKLTIEVNSARRADLARAEVKKRLGGKAFGPSIEAASLDLTWPPKAPPTGGSRTASPESSRVSLRDHPEVAAMMRAQEEAHWDSWIHEKIPALGNKKPSQLVKTAEGREMVEALLRSFERRPRPDEFGGREDIDGVRARLGLPPRRPGR